MAWRKILIRRGMSSIKDEVSVSYLGAARRPNANNLRTVALDGFWDVTGQAWGDRKLFLQNCRVDMQGTNEMEPRCESTAQAK